MLTIYPYEVTTVVDHFAVVNDQFMRLSNAQLASRLGLVVIDHEGRNVTNQVCFDKNMVDLTKINQRQPLPVYLSTDGERQLLSTFNVTLLAPGAINPAKFSKRLEGILWALTTILLCGSAWGLCNLAQHKLVSGDTLRIMQIQAKHELHKATNWIKIKPILREREWFPCFFGVITIARRISSCDYC